MFRLCDRTLSRLREALFELSLPADLLRSGLQRGTLLSQDVFSIGFTGTAEIEMESFDAKYGTCCSFLK